MEIILILIGLLFAAFVVGAVALTLLGITVGTVSAAWHAGKGAEPGKDEGK